MGGVALVRGLDEAVESAAGIRFRRDRLDLGVLEPYGHVVSSIAGGHDGDCLALQLFEVDIPDPGDVGAVGLAVVEGDQEVVAFGEVDGGSQRLVEAGWVLGEDEVEVPAAKFHALLAAEGGAEVL